MANNDAVSASGLEMHAWGVMAQRPLAFYGKYFGDPSSICADPAPGAGKVDGEHLRRRSSSSSTSGSLLGRGEYVEPDLEVGMELLSDCSYSAVSDR